MTTLGLFLLSFCFAQAVFGQNLYNDYFGSNRISNTVDIIGDGRGRLGGSVSTYNPFTTGSLGGLDSRYSLNPRSSWMGRSGLASPYLGTTGLLNSRLGSTFGSGERGNNWSNLFQRLNRRRYLRRRGSDSSEERGRGRGLYNRYNRYNRHLRRYGSNSASSEERRRSPYNRIYRRRWGDSSEERRGGRFRNLYNRRWGSDSGERRRRRGWGRNWSGSRSSQESGEWWRRRRFSTRSPYRNLYDSDERGVYNRPNRWRNYRNIINRMRSPYPYHNNAYSYGNRLSLFNNRWNS